MAAHRSSRLARSHRISNPHHYGYNACVPVTCVHCMCSTYSGAMMAMLPAGQLVLGAPHLLKGRGLSCGERKGTQHMLLNGDEARLRARPASLTRTCIHSARYSPWTMTALCMHL